MTNFYPEPPRDPQREAEEAAAEVVEAVAPAVHLTAACPMLPAGPLVELPPPL